MDRLQQGNLSPNAYENRGGRLIAIITVWSIVATAAVCLRLYVRLVILRKPAADDWLLVVALVCFPSSFIELSS